MAEADAGAAGGAANNGAAAGDGAASGASAAGDAAAAAAAANGAAANGAAADAGKGAGAAADAGAADWRASITDPEQKEFASRLASPADAVKVAYDLRKANGSMVRVPAKDAKPEDVAKFHKAIGVPEKPEEYKFDIGREPTDEDKQVQGEIAKVFHANGVPAAAVTAVSKAVTELAQAQLAEQNRVAVQARTDAEANLKKELGADYSKHVNLAVRAVEVFGGDELKTFLNTTIVNGAKLGDHPMLIKAMGKVGLRMGEGEFIGAVGSAEKGSLQAEMQQIMADNPPGTEKYKSPAVQKRLGEINTALYGSAPIVGMAGRSA